MAVARCFLGAQLRMKKDEKTVGAGLTWSCAVGIVVGVPQVAAAEHRRTKSTRDDLDVHHHGDRVDATRLERSSKSLRQFKADVWKSKWWLLDAAALLVGDSARTLWQTTQSSRSVPGGLAKRKQKHRGYTGEGDFGHACHKKLYSYITPSFSFFPSVTLLASRTD